MKNTEKHIIVAKVDNNPGVVSRISGLFTRRGYNIESLVTSVTQNPEIYYLTISVISTEEEARLLIRQLSRIMEVIETYKVGDRKCVTRELMFVKIECAAGGLSDVIKIADVMGYKTAGVGENSAVIEVCGDEDALDNAIRTLSPHGITEIVRSGAVSIQL